MKVKYVTPPFFWLVIKIMFQKNDENLMFYSNLVVRDRRG